VETVRDAMTRGTAQLRAEGTGHRASDAYTTRPFSVLLFDEALRDATRSFPEQSPAELQALSLYPTIAATSKAHKLNEKQHRAFNLCASALVRTWKRIEGTANPRDELTATAVNAEDEHQLRLIINGEGGTGKSTVVQAVLAFVSLWNRPSAVRTIAATGIAAVNISGRTIHSALELSISVTKSGHEKKPPSKQLIKEWCAFPSPQEVCLLMLFSSL
jgi:hypothetical protein